MEIQFRDDRNHGQSYMHIAQWRLGTNGKSGRDTPDI